MLSTTEVLSIGTVERIHIAGTTPTYVVTLSGHRTREILALALSHEGDEDRAMALRLEGAENAYAETMHASANKWRRLAEHARESGSIVLTWTQAARLAPIEDTTASWPTLAPWPPLARALVAAAHHGTGTLIDD